MIPRLLGDTGVRLHPVGLGCMSLSGFYGESSEEEAFSLLARALEVGVNFWDTANVYGEGSSETRIGKFLAQDRSRRGKVTLASKFSIRRLEDGSRAIDNTEAHMVEALEGSLRRLGVDHIDLYYVHRLDQRRPIEDTIAALARQVEKGKIGAIGLSEMAPDTLRRAHGVHKISAMQSEYSLWTRSPELGLIQTCRELGVSFVAFSPVARGALGGQIRDVGALPKTDFRRSNPRFVGAAWRRNLVRIEGFLALARRLERDPGELAIAWTLAQGEHIVAIPGTRYADTLARNAQAAERPLSGAEVGEIERVLPVGWAAGDRYTDAQWTAIERYC